MAGGISVHHSTCFRLQACLAKKAHLLATNQLQVMQDGAFNATWGMAPAALQGHMNMGMQLCMSMLRCCAGTRAKGWRFLVIAAVHARGAGTAFPGMATYVSKQENPTGGQTAVHAPLARLCRHAGQGGALAGCSCSACA